MKAMGKARLAAGALLAASLTLTACASNGSDAGSDGGESTDEVKVILDFIFSDGFGRLAYGLEQGYFEDRGIDLKVTPGRGGDLALQQINAGKVDFAFADLSEYLQQRVEGQTETTAIYAWINVPQICVASLEPLESPQDMEGKTFSTVGFSAGRTTVPYVLQHNGVDPDTVNIQVVDISVLMTQLLSGASETVESAQFGSLEANTITVREAGKELYCTPLSDWGHRDYGKMLIVRDEVLENDPDLVKRVVEAMHESTTEAMANASGDDIYEALKTVSPQVKEESAKAAWESERTELKDLGPIKEDDVAYSLEFLAATAGVSTDDAPSTFYDNSFIPTR